MQHVCVKKTDQSKVPPESPEWLAARSHLLALCTPAPPDVLQTLPYLSPLTSQCMPLRKGKEKTAHFGGNSMRSQILHWAAQGCMPLIQKASMHKTAGMHMTAKNSLRLQALSFCSGHMYRDCRLHGIIHKFSMYDINMKDCHVVANRSQKRLLHVSCKRVI